MRDEHFVDLKGKRFVLFEGLLAEAHDRGLKGIEVELVQLPTEENGRVAVCKAKVEMQDGQTFVDVGDASPENVSRNIVVHIIRMSSTRAKARALRDACNIGATALEELSEPPEAPTEARQETAVSSSTLSLMEVFAREQLGWDDEKVGRAVAKWEGYSEAKAEDAYETMRSMVSQGA